MREISEEATYILFIRLRLCYLGHIVVVDLIIIISAAREANDVYEPLYTHYIRSGICYV